MTGDKVTALEESLVTGLVHNPLDVGTSLVLADWVAERGGNDSPLRTRVAYVWLTYREDDGNQLRWVHFHATKDLAIEDAVCEMDKLSGVGSYKREDLPSGTVMWVREDMTITVHKEMINEGKSYTLALPNSNPPG